MRIQFTVTDEELEILTKKAIEEVSQALLNIVSVAVYKKYKLCWLIYYLIKQN